MSVSRAGSSPVQGGDVGSTKRTDKSAAAGESRKTDRASDTAEGGARSEISGRAKEFAKARETAANTPDVREEKVAELKRRIQSGQYKVDADAVADRMIQDHAAF
jgi:negative regulator of flagellin synthesis FlgM